MALGRFKKHMLRMDQREKFDIVNSTCFDNLDFLFQFLFSNATEKLEQHDPAATVMAAFGVVVMAANLSSLLAILQVRKELTSYFRLMISLNVSDMLVGLCCAMTSLNFEPLGGHSELCLFMAWRGLRMTSHVVSLLNLLGLGLDHFLAVMKPFEYRRMWTSARVNCLIIAAWVASFAAGFSDFFIPSSNYSHCSGDQAASESTTVSPDPCPRSGNVSETTECSAPSGRRQCNVTRTFGLRDTAESSELRYCERVLCSKYDSEYLVLVLVAVLFVTITFCYTKVCMAIYDIGKPRRVQTHNLRGLMTTLLIVGTFMACWLPYSIFNIVTIVRMAVDQESAVETYSLAVKLDVYLYGLLLLNSLCDPLIYALRMRDVRWGYFRLLRCCCRTYSDRMCRSLSYPSDQSHTPTRTATFARSVVKVDSVEPPNSQTQASHRALARV